MCQISGSYVFPEKSFSSPTVFTKEPLQSQAEETAREP